MRILYSLILMLSTPFVLLYLALRGLRNGAYLRRWQERFGFIKPGDSAGGILLHVASVGEFNAAGPLINALQREHPGLPLAVTTLTPTGSEQVKRSLGDRVFHSYIPIDLPGAVRRFLDRLQPRLIIVIETEIWPNLYHRAHCKNIPLLMASARLSERSARHFRVVPALVSNILETVSWIGAQSTVDADRFVACGAKTESVNTTGNLKFDLNVPASLEEKGEALRSRWNHLRPVLVAGSTHEEDENVLIPAFVSLLEKLPDALLILVPRHPERFGRTAQLAKTAGLQTELRSQGEACTFQAQCFVIDTIGELMTYYACADVAYVGGSMGNQGGHNALEPAALGKPILFGPNMVNARDIAYQLLECAAARLVNDQADLLKEAAQILTDGVLRDRMGQAGRRLVESNTGALELSLKAIERTLTVE